MSDYRYYKIQHRHKDEDRWVGSALPHLLFAHKSPAEKRGRAADQWRKLIHMAEANRYPDGRGTEDFDVVATLWRELDRLHGDRMIFRIVEVTGTHDEFEIKVKAFDVPVLHRETARNYEEAERLVRASLGPDSHVVDREGFKLCGRDIRMGGTSSCPGPHIFVDQSDVCLCGEANWGRY